MSFTFLAESGEESSAASFSDIPVSVLSRLNLTDEKPCSNGSETEFCPNSQSGMMSEPSTAIHGEERSMSCVPESPVSDTQPVDSCSETNHWSNARSELLARFDPLSCSWKMSQAYLFDHLEPLLECWPDWAATRGLELWAHVTPDWITCENDAGWLRTPCKSDGKKWYVSGFTETARRNAGRQPMLIHQLIEYHGLSKGWANPEFWELMMDWPIGWTDLRPLGMAKFQQWLDSHGKR